MPESLRPVSRYPIQMLILTSTGKFLQIASNNEAMNSLNSNTTDNARRHLPKYALIIPASTILILLGIMVINPVFYRIVIYNFSDIDDYKIFDNRTLTASQTPFTFAINKNSINLPEQVPTEDNLLVTLDRFLTDTNTLAFLVIKDDAIVYEKYLDGHTETSISIVFSVTKAFTSALIGAALQDAYIQNLQQPVTDYIPELKDRGFEKVKLLHLLQMTAGMDYPDNGLFNSPFGKQAFLTYTPSIEDELSDIELDIEPGTQFRYQSVNYALLALVLKRAMKNKTLTEYLQQRFWTPLGMEHDGLWSVDHLPDGLEKSWCCLNMTARDLAKFGRLYLNKGMWNGVEILPADWIQQSTAIDVKEGSKKIYQLGWWIMSPESGDYRAEGVRGQFLYINPEKNLIIVRLGKNRGGLEWITWKNFFSYFARHIN
ncbi:MAG: serine hydrolase [Gammaproteobacteria bacterium]|nr:serine hydrolase [Gammaproteobacteria bacterium]